MKSIKRAICFAVIMSALLSLYAFTVLAQKLPIRCYDVSDGLAHGEITSIYQDSKGYLWFTTFEGLNLFDGYDFKTFDTHDGLGNIIVNNIKEDANGRLWVSTNDGIGWMVDEPYYQFINGRDTNSVSNPYGKRFTSFKISEANKQANAVNSFTFDAKGNLWCLTDRGLYRSFVKSNESLKFDAFSQTQDSGDSHAILKDNKGSLWFSVKAELIEVNTENDVINHGMLGGNLNELITGIAETDDRKIIVASYYHLFEFTPSESKTGEPLWKPLPLELKAGHWINAMLKDDSGVLWLGTSSGLIKYESGQQTLYTTANGLSVDHIRSLSTDNYGNLWIGTVGGGACKFSGERIVSYTKAEGLRHNTIAGFIKDRKGRLLADLSDGYFAELADGKLGLPQKESVLPVISSLSSVLRNKYGLWQSINNQTAFSLSKEVLTLQNGNEVFLKELVSEEDLKRGVEFYEDENGKLWFSKKDKKIHRVDITQPNRPTIESFEADFPLTTTPIMITDRAGGLWLSEREVLGHFYQGKFIYQKPGEGLPETNPRSMFVDSRGWLWIGLRYGGVSVTEEPGKEFPRFVNFNAEKGQLSSNTVWSIEEDDNGIMYFGTGRGLSRYNPATKSWQHFTSKDGLQGNVITYLQKDNYGNIWVKTTRGLSRFNPHIERENNPAPVYINRVEIAGENLSLPVTGVNAIPKIELASNRNNLTIEYIGLDFQREDSLHYQYKLEGIDADWSAATKERSVTYARLAPGTYRFVVRIVKDAHNAQSATFEFIILRPVWQRWWFIALVVLFVCGLAYALYRYRISRLLEMANMRTRIATDLHDDIGANLTRIALLSEVAKQNLTQNGKDEHNNPLSSIANIARESVSSMSDIVWAIDPERDHLIDLIRKMRQHADEVFTLREIQLKFNAPESESNLKLGVAARRDLLLIFKEAVNNAARHSDCTKVSIDFRVEDGKLSLTIADDGKGFTPSFDGEGQGLRSMKRRAENLGGTLAFDSSNKLGTTVKFILPLSNVRSVL